MTPDPTPVACCDPRNRPVAVVCVVIVTTDGSAAAATADVSVGVEFTALPVRLALVAGAAVGAVAVFWLRPNSSRAKVEPDASTAERTAAPTTAPAPGTRRRRGVASGAAAGAGAGTGSAAVLQVGDESKVIGVPHRLCVFVTPMLVR